MKRRVAAFLFFVVIGFTACKDEYSICNLDRQVNFIAGFYNASGTPRSATRFTLSLLNSSLSIYNNQQNITSFSIPLNPGVDSAKYVISVDAALQADTITIVYTSTATILSPECGSVFFNNLTAVRTTLNTLDSVKISNAHLNTTPVENVRIFF